MWTHISRSARADRDMILRPTSDEDIERAKLVVLQELGERGIRLRLSYSRICMSVASRPAIGWSTCPGESIASIGIDDRTVAVRPLSRGNRVAGCGGKVSHATSWTAKPFGDLPPGRRENGTARYRRHPGGRTASDQALLRSGCRPRRSFFDSNPGGCSPRAPATRRQVLAAVNRCAKSGVAYSVFAALVLSGSGALAIYAATTTSEAARRAVGRDVIKDWA